MIVLRGLGQQHLDPAWFTTAAAQLTQFGAGGQARHRSRVAQRQASAEAGAALPSRWTSPEATVTANALRDWCVAGERVEQPEADAYRALDDLAVKARATAAVIERVERWERNWIEQLGGRVLEGGFRGTLNVSDALGVVSDADAQRARDELDQLNAVREQASAEREAALRAWSEAVEATAAAVARATEALRWATVPVPEALLPHRGRTPQETAQALREQWSKIKPVRVPGDPAAFREHWDGLSPDQRRELVRDDPATVADYLLWVAVHGSLADDPVHAELLRGAEEDRAGDRPVDHSLRKVLVGAAVADARKRALPPSEYQAQLREHWLYKALDRAGVDIDQWRPEAGAEANAEIIEQVYRYYGELFLAHPELQWAGMANIIGPSFAGGFHDLDSMRQFARSMAERINQLPEPVRAGLPPALRDIGRLAEASDEELSFYVTTLLGMQREIFFDQAVAHEAYLAGGVPAIEELAGADLLDRATADGWGKIHRGATTGDQSLIAEGNLDLLHREQWRVIRDDYDMMRNRPGTGDVMTYLMGAVGQPSVPGSRAYGEVHPFEVRVPTPGPDRLPGGLDNPLQATVAVVTPLPDGNISQVDSRWRLILDDTMPAYQRLLREDPAGARRLVASPLRERFDDNRLQARWPELLGRFDDWSIRIEQ